MPDISAARPLREPAPCAGEGEAGTRQANERAAGEAALYAPVKRWLEACGYEIKGEVCGCDLVARRGDEPPVIVELKLRFNLALLLQGIDRLAISERVYLAVPRRLSRQSSRRGHSAPGLAPDAPAIRRLCRRVGLGLILVNADSVAVVEEPVPYRPRLARRRAARLAAEFDRRLGDPNIGGIARAPVVTAYRQDALRVLHALAENGPMRLELRAATGIGHAARILQRNVYGWFVRLGRASYGLSPGGHDALERFAGAVAPLAGAPTTERAVA